MITILTSRSKLARANGAVALLFGCAPDTPSLPAAEHRAGPEELLGSRALVKAAAHRVALKLLEDEPAFRGVRQLGVFEEVLTKELERSFQLVHLDAWLRASGHRACRFLEPSDWAVGLQAAAARMRSGYRVQAPAARSSQAFVPVLEDSGWSLPDLARLPGRAVLRAFPFGARLARGFRHSRHERSAPERWWFYSTAYTFTRIGLAYERVLPWRWNYLVENEQTGGRPLAEQRRRSRVLYEFAEWRDRPSRREVAEAREAIEAHLGRVPLAGDESLARDLLLAGGWMGLFLARLLPLGLFHSRILARWLEVERPEAIVVGNSVFEGYALQQARERGIPTVLLQHGVLGDYYQLVDQPVDHVVVRGSVFREFLSPAARQHSVVLNVPGTADRSPLTPALSSVARERGCDLAEPGGHDLLFLTTPYTFQPFLHEADIEDVLRVLARVGAAARRRLIVRVHPLESVARYRRFLLRIMGQEGIELAYELSQGGALVDVLRRSAVAVTFASSVFLDCLEARVPVVSFGWHDYSLRPLIEKYGVFHFASTLADLASLVEKGLRGGLSAAGGDVARAFLAPTTAEEVRRFFASVRDGKLAGHASGGESEASRRALETTLAGRSGRPDSKGEERRGA